MLSRLPTALRRAGNRAKSTAISRTNAGGGAAARRGGRSFPEEFMTPFFDERASLLAPRPLERLFDTFLPTPRVFDQLERQMDRAWKTVGLPDMTLDVTESKNEYVVSAEVPGVAASDLKVDFDEETGILSIVAEKRVSSGEAPQQAEAKEAAAGGAKAEGAPEPSDAARWHRAERAYGRIERSLRLPSDVAFDKITAKLDHGVLTLTVPRTTENGSPSRKRIDVESVTPSAEQQSGSSGSQATSSSG